MPFVEDIAYNQSTLKPLFDAAGAMTFARKIQANSTIRAGTPLGLTTTGVNAVQTLTITGTPTGGTFKLSFKGIKTATIAYNAAAATVQAALEALISIGSGNVACTGGALPGTPVVITFQGSLAASPQPLIVWETDDNALTGGTAPTGSVAHTTTGIAAGALKAWDGTLVAAPAVPTVSAQAGGSVFGDGTNSFQFLIQVSFYNETGETLPSVAAPVVVAAGNRTIRVAAYAGVGAAVQGARVYANGVRIAEIAKSGADIPQTDIATIAGSGQPPALRNECFTARDGSHVLRGFAMLDMATDAEGKVTYGRESAGNDQGQKFPEGQYYASGLFRIGDLYGITSSNGPQLDRFGSFLDGAYNNVEGIYRLGYK